VDIPLLISDIELEFALLGPWDGKQAVLIYGPKPNLLHLGAARASGLETKRFSRQVVQVSHQPGKIESICLVGAEVKIDDETKLQKFVLTWTGRALDEDLIKVETFLGNCAIELHRNLKKKDVQEVRWQLAPLLVQCSEANAKAWRIDKLRREMNIKFAIAMGGLFLIVVVILIAAYVVTHWK
jgi:hypothetical protein